MQLLISHKLNEHLVLPMNYQYIIQSIIYRSIGEQPTYSEFVHDQGYNYMDRSYRMFVFDFLQGKYETGDGKIVFRDRVSFSVRSPEVSFIRLLKEAIEKKGINYLGQHYDDIELTLMDETITTDTLKIKMRSPISVYSTNPDTGKSYFYTPEESGFYELVNENFLRKYLAYTGVMPSSRIVLTPVMISPRDKFVTKYKGYYVSGWNGTYELMGEPKYLDFLYQAGLGSRNSQGFGMFDVVKNA